jgi:hypothetical protein
MGLRECRRIEMYHVEYAEVVCISPLLFNPSLILHALVSFVR